MYQVMVVEKDPALAKLYQEELGDAGFKVVTSPDLNQALASLLRKPAHVLVTDVDMVGMRPNAWLRSLRRYHPGGVLLLDRRRRCSQTLGGMDVMAKSSDLSPLVSRLRSMAGSVIWGRPAGVA